MIELLRTANVESAPVAFTELARIMIDMGRAPEATRYRDDSERGASLLARVRVLLRENEMPTTANRT